MIYTLFKKYIFRWPIEMLVTALSLILAITATIYSYKHGYIIVYGDAESHLNIAKRVIDSLTPGFAQLGGIWLPLPHLLLVPFVYFNFLWRTGLAGSIVSGVCYVISSLYIYKLTVALTRSSLAAFVAAFIFMTNPNILYMQTTPMTELTLIVFFMLSSYYFIIFLRDQKKILNLILAAFFGFCASLSRYDGWALVCVEAAILFLFYLPYTTIASSVTSTWKKLEGRLILFCTLAFLGIALWLMWGWLILGDPLYFTHSQFSASSQQNSWLLKGELPGYKNILVSLQYYLVTSISNIGVILSALAAIGLVIFTFAKKNKYRFFILLVLAVPLFFNVLTLYLGQSVIFIPGLTPASFDWHLFNVRYGIMMVPFAAICIGYLFYKSRTFIRLFIFGLIVFQFALYGTGRAQVISLEDGRNGLSSAVAKMPDAQFWFAEHYDYGKLLIDDFAKTISIIRTPVNMKDVIYIGNKPYWDESLIAPEKYARWIVIQRDDALWKAIWEQPAIRGRLFKYFNQVYTSNNILIFRRMNNE